MVAVAGFFLIQPAPSAQSAATLNAPEDIGRLKAAYAQIQAGDRVGGTSQMQKLFEEVGSSNVVVARTYAALLQQLGGREDEAADAFIVAQQLSGGRDLQVTSALLNALMAAGRYNATIEASTRYLGLLRQAALGPQPVFSNFKTKAAEYAAIQKQFGEQLARFSMEVVKGGSKATRRVLGGGAYQWAEVAQLLQEHSCHWKMTPHDSLVQALASLLGRDALDERAEEEGGGQRGENTTTTQFQALIKTAAATVQALNKAGRTITLGSLDAELLQRIIAQVDVGSITARWEYVAVIIVA
jgi:hypothetical protein